MQLSVSLCTQSALNTVPVCPASSYLTQWLLQFHMTSSQYWKYLVTFNFLIHANQLILSCLSLTLTSSNVELAASSPPARHA